nr:MAG TPA: portal protein [Caudoviricetes sp.]
MTSIKQYLTGLGYNVINDDFYGKIAQWMGWYKGKVPAFHCYSQYNGKNRIRRSRATLGMAKKVCEDWANLILNEKVELSIADAAAQEAVDQAFEANQFKTRGNQLVELAFALGTGAFVEYLDRGRVVIDYIRADMIYPLAWENGKITECAFASEKVVDKTICIYLNLHILENGTYRVRNQLFKKEDFSPLPLPLGVAEEYDTGAALPLFQIITPNLINNVDLDNPMGVSVFAGALDILQGVDLVYDSYQNEFRLGKKRIIVPAGMAQIQSGENGFTPLFDDNDTEFYAMYDKSLTDLKEINMELRAEPHEKALQKNLNLLSSKCGLGNDRFSYERSGVKTATEVISEKSDLYQNLRKHELVAREALCGIARAICHLRGLNAEFDVSVGFDDSIIEDTNAIAQRAMQERTAGIIDDVEYLTRVYKLTEEDALRKVSEMRQRAPDAPDGFGDDE